MNQLLPFSRLQIASLALLLASAPSMPLRAQTPLPVEKLPASEFSLSGNWMQIFHEDEPERGGGPEVGDYLGLPITNGARKVALSWDSSRMSVEEHQCQVHVVPYIYRGPTQLYFSEDRDPETQRVIAIKNYISNYQQTRTIWMDDRPHPSEYAPHTWMGFSTGKWEGPVLTVYTTHIKPGFVRRNGLPESDRATLIEHFIRYGDDLLTHVSILTDPVYLTEPLIKSQDFAFKNFTGVSWTWPCEPVTEIRERSKDAVPQYLPGENPYVKEFPRRHGVPEQAAMGGAETMYPEYQLKLKQMPVPAPQK